MSLTQSTTSTRLTELAATINDNDVNVEKALVNALHAAIAVGHALLEARTLVPDGQWHEWLTANTRIDRRRAWKYQLLAEHEDELQTLYVEGDPPTMESAERYLREIGASLRRSGKPYQLPAGMRTDAKTMRENGESLRQIGLALGVNYQTVREWVDPDLHRRSKMRQRERHRRRREVERQLKAKETTAEEIRSVKKLGGSVPEAFALVRRAAIELDKALVETVDTPEIRMELRSAKEHVNKAHDAIVRASRGAP